MDDSFPFHPKTIAAGNAAVGAWVRMLTWCSQQLTDGRLPASLALVCGTPADVAKLVEVRLLDETPTGYAIHDYLDYNPSRAHVLAERARWQARQNKARVTGGVTGGVTHGVTVGVTGDPSRDSPRPVPVPVPMASSPSEKKPRARRAAPPAVPRHTWYQDARFAKMVAPWPEGNRGSTDAAFAFWEGQGEDGKARIEARCREIVATTQPQFLKAPLKLFAEIIHAPYTPPAVAGAAAPGKLSDQGRALLDASLGVARPPAITKGGA